MRINIKIVIDEWMQLYMYITNWFVVLRQTTNYRNCIIIFLYPLLINQVHIEFIRYYFLFQSRELLPYVFSRGSFHFEKKTYLLSSYGILTSCVINLFTLFNRLFFDTVHKISTGFVLKNLSISVWIFFVCLVSIYWTTRFAASNRLYPTLLSFYVSKIKSKNTFNQS